MTDEQLEAITASMPGGAGMPRIDRKMAASMMRIMKPEAMEGMMKMAAEMKDGVPSADAMSKIEEMMKDRVHQFWLGYQLFHTRHQVHDAARRC